MHVQLERASLALVLQGPPLARGGEAAIYEMPQHPQWLAKVYHKPTTCQAAKLSHMIAAPPIDPMAGRGHVSIAWPLDRLLAAGSERACLGYVMPRVIKARPLFEFYNPKARLQQCPLFHFGYLMRTARNLAIAVRALHERGYVIGDLNESNVLVNNKALVTIVDTDSFQVSATDQVYRCPVGKLEYTPPELQGARFAEVDRRPEHDCFALAVLIFQLLMQGVHPFTGIYTGQGEPAVLAERIQAGHWPYAQQRGVPYKPSPLAPVLDTLPPPLPQLMYRCFEDGHHNPAVRPDASTWQKALQKAEKELVACPVNAQHLYAGALSACPWCRLARVQKRDLFPSRQDIAAARAASSGVRSQESGVRSPAPGKSRNDPSAVAYAADLDLPPLVPSVSPSPPGPGSPALLPVPGGPSTQPVSGASSVRWRVRKVPPPRGPSPEPGSFWRAALLWLIGLALLAAGAYFLLVPPKPTPRPPAPSSTSDR
jgi:DNA-binding helix-hairpin-helix protein with protein kinase domain